MQTPEDVAQMLRLKAAGLGIKHIARKMGWRRFAAQPSLDAKLVRELATCRCNGDALLLLGPPGVGKTHLAVALGREAIQHGYSTLFTSATAMVTALTKAHHSGRLEERLLHFTKPKL